MLLPRGGIPPLARRRSRHPSEHGHRRGQIVDAVSIGERPAEAEDRAIPGHWEGDLLSGGKNSYIATLVERHSRFLMLVKVPSKETEPVVAALSEHVRQLPATLRRSLTWDRGLEMAKHKDFTVATDVQVYFCDPQSPWQRGSNENTNLLLRQYSPREGRIIHAKRRERIDLNTINAYQTALAYLNDRVGDLPLASIDNPQARILISQMKSEQRKDGQRGFSDKTIVNYFQVFRKVVASELDEKFNPVHRRNWNLAAIGLPRVNRRKQRRPTLTAKEMTTLLSKAEGDYQMLYFFLLETGLRVSEAVAIDGWGRSRDRTMCDCRAIFVSF